MTRSVPEWIGANPDTAIPRRVKLRIFDAQKGKCAGCERKLGVAGEQIDFDHIKALVNGGENREANLQALCPFCHAPKTKADVAEKSEVNRVKAKHLGFNKEKPSNPLPGGKGSKWKKTIGGGWVRRDE